MASPNRYAAIRSILLYGLALGAVLLMLEAVHFKALLRDVSLELYGGIIAVLFAGIGIWVGISFFTRKPEAESELPGPVSDPEAYDLSQREMEVLRLLAEGHTNQQIAEQLFVSLNTIKTHTSRIYAKLDVSRRTQAVQRARELQLI